MQNPGKKQGKKSRNRKPAEVANPVSTQKDGRGAEKAVPQDPTSLEGEVLCFASPKGGAGKTILAVSTAYALAKSGRRVIMIDGDFSTRGLSIFLLGDVLTRERYSFHPENCLAESFLEHIAAKSVQPRNIAKPDFEIDVILSNVELWNKGIPDEAMLGLAPYRTVVTGQTSINGGETAQKSTPSQAGPPGGAEAYLQFFHALCQRLRREYDHIIIDTRGGMDYTSAMPALVADKVSIVAEYDLVTLTQLAGFNDALETLTTLPSKLNLTKLVPAMRLVVNKLETRPRDEGQRKLIKQSFGVPVIGYIPFDLQASRCYRNCDIPLQQFPESDFALDCIEMVDKLCEPKLKWKDQRSIKLESVVLFHLLSKRIQQHATARRLIEWLFEFVPQFQVVLIFIGLLLFLLFFWGQISPTGFTLAFGIFFLIASALDFLRLPRLWPLSKLPAQFRGLALFALGGVWILVALTVMQATSYPSLAHERSIQIQRACEAMYASLDALSERGFRLSEQAQVLAGVSSNLAPEELSIVKRDAWSREALYTWVVIPKLTQNDEQKTQQRIDEAIRLKNWSRFHLLRAFLTLDFNEKLKGLETALKLNEAEFLMGDQKNPLILNNLAYTMLKIELSGKAPNASSILSALDRANTAIQLDAQLISEKNLRFPRAAYFDTRGEICAALADLNHDQRRPFWRQESIDTYKLAVKYATLPSEQNDYKLALGKQEELAKRQTDKKSIEKSEKSGDLN